MNAGDVLAAHPTWSWVCNNADGTHTIRCIGCDARTTIRVYADRTPAHFAHVEAMLAEAGIGPVGVCDCYSHGFTPDTYEGPQETCPVHGRPYAEWVERAAAAEEELTALRGPIAEAERRGAQRVLAAVEALHATEYAKKACPSCRAARAAAEER